MKPFGSKLKIYRSATLALTLWGVGAEAQRLVAEEAWTSSRAMLEPSTNPQTKISVSYPILDNLRGILLRSLNNPNNLKTIAEIQTNKGTKAHAVTQGILLPQGMSSHAKQEASARGEVTKVIAIGAQKETKIDVLPKELKDSLTFNWGGSKQPAPTRGRDQVRYGLILTSIEPSPHSLKLASMNSAHDYEMLAYAGKAELHYAVGPFHREENSASYPVAAPTVAPAATLRSYLPKAEFNGKISPSGLPSAESPLPPQVISIDQSQGFYSIEAKIEKQLSPSTATHRMRVPLYQAARYVEERDKDFKLNKTSLENFYSRGGLACNLEDFRVEKRYQAAAIYTLHRSRIEVNAHVPKAALEGNFWPQHRWELKLETSF